MVQKHREVDRKRRKGVDGIRRVGRRELIDTLWNAYNICADHKIFECPKLIDTLWNAYLDAF